MSDSPSEEERRKRERQRIQRQLDEALAASFPASDPVSIVTSHQEEDWGGEAMTPPPGAPEAPPKER
jgi:2-methylcitrate dehydratase PrpD